MFWRGLLVCCAAFVLGSTGTPTTGPSSPFCPRVCNCSGQSDGQRWDCERVDSPSQLWAVSDPAGPADPRQVLSALRHLRLRNSDVEVLRPLFNVSLDLQIEISDFVIVCNQSNLWLLDVARLRVDGKSVHCAGPETLKGTPASKVLHLIREVDWQCPERCTCDLLHVPKDDQFVTVSINCKNQGFTELPKVLPANVTIHLDLSDNQIDDVSDLVMDANYRRVTVLYLNNNRIKSISVLENSDWIRNFSQLSLQGNSLEKISTEALTNAFRHRDLNGFRMFLSNNPWRCDCLTVTNFQAFIAKHKQLIKDASNITCGPNEGEIAGKKIVSVESNALCRNPDDNAVNLMDVLNVCLAFLTVCIIGKLLYDYYAYRKTGRLPWLVSKMP